MGKAQVEQFEESIEMNKQKLSDNPYVKTTISINRLTTSIPFSQWLQNNKMEAQFAKFLETLKKV